ncbi:hypothetical protein GW777_06865 [Candidatus Peregrinibacteria bacterium]|nr:hypothetical protein [Candidatus Parcubacteria bacterium]NCS68074.1 hypothetical protein [Candidatus Peregrinibacteria bacterium]PIX85815.1 MAG: hypothetical protein COZ32_06610 [Nitrospirae bacterium CG_4_10_14_3_um_filter_53_41]
MNNKIIKHNLTAMTKLFTLLVLIVAGLFVFSVPAAGAGNTRYVDKDSKGGTCSDSNSGTISQPWCTISKANQTLSAGDTVYIRGGTYSEAIVPQTSGTSDTNMITYINYTGESPIISGINGYPISFNNKQYIKVKGITLKGNSRFAEISGSNNIVLDGNNFSDANFNTGYVSIFLYGGSHHNKIINNFIGNNSIGDIIRTSNGADYNLFENNTVVNGGHSCINIRSRYNIIRNNVFDNPLEKATEIAYQVSGSWDVMGVAEFNVLENNIIRNAGPTYNYNGLQLTAPKNIIRFNEFYNNIGSGIGLGTTGSGLGPGGNSVDPYADNNHIYHNTIYKNGILVSQTQWQISYGMSLTEYNHDGTKVTNNKIVNNLFYKNNPNYNNPNYYSSSCKSDPNCLTTYPINFNVGNHVYQIDVDRNVQGTGNYFGSDQELLGPNFSQNSNQNYLDPLFVDEANKNFKLTSGSPYIDKGEFLTKTVGSGNGNIVTVNDAMYFTDGFGLVEGDTIKIGNDIVKITAINYNNNQLTINNNITWSNSEGVSFPYSGSAPDIGAHEYQSTLGDTTPPAAPTGAREI